MAHAQTSVEHVNTPAERARVLSCGHPPSPHDTHTTGTALVWEEGQPEREICWGCAEQRELAELRTAQTYTAYLSGDGTQLQGWPGWTLARVTYLHEGRHNIGGKLYRFRAVDVHGGRWYGTTPGKGMYARMRRVKSEGVAK